MNPKHARLTTLMTAYNAGDPKRIQHFIKVYQLASVIGTSEQLDEETLFILETAAIVHDIGIHISEQKYGACDGKHQEQEGPAEARKLLEATGDYTALQTDRVCWLIAHHHTYKDITGMDYQILVEADFLVNIYEDHLSAEAVDAVKRNIFRTRTGIELLENMFEKSYSFPSHNTPEKL
ncbi:HD domain-containing protein [Mediterranea massiliensis]|uniref:HD domain-containing protein n=1 Tax=Mediterranea massiliensis TaxID=1841865 RepID=UPI002805263D|nr:HD domain-containing protein [uncultured Mediterranea sp.]